MPLKFVKSRRGKSLLVHEGYIYTCKSVNKNSITWRCNEHSGKMSCSLIVRTTSQDKNGSIIGDPPVHSHPVDIAAVKAKSVRAKLKRRAVTNDAGPMAVIAEAVEKIGSPVVARLGTVSSMQRTIQRARQENVFKVCENVLGDFVVPNELRRTARNGEFLLYDSESRRYRYLIFSTASNLKKLAECEIWCGDGTFRSVPAIFEQLYTIHGVIGYHTIPLVYVLSSSKSQVVYIRILRKLKELLPSSIKLRRMLIDFELAYMNAFAEIFSGVHISGCLFHYKQCVWRHVQNEGLQTRYNSVICFSENIRMLMAIAFVPVDKVIIAYDELVKSQFFVDNEEILFGLLDYYESTWIEVLKRNRKERSAPLFSIPIWNCYLTVINNEIRSNNGIEGWHHSFNDLVRVSHASATKFINHLRTEQNIVDLKLLQLRTGSMLPKRHKMYRNYNERLKNIVKSYDADDNLQYLKNIAGVLRV